jgi:uncharacterized membrane protein YcaP (DUF421 family)
MDLVNLDPTNLLTIALRSVVVYLVILLLLRLGGKRELGQMTPFDLVVLLLLANAVQNAMVGVDASLTGGLLAAATILAANWVVDRLGLHSVWLRRELRGSPTLLVHDGSLVEPNLRREGIAEEEVLQALREHGVSDLQQVKLAVLEIDGTISIVAADAPVGRTRRRVRARKPSA